MIRTTSFLALLVLATACGDQPPPSRSPARTRSAPAGSRSGDDAQRSMELGEKLQSEKSFAEATVAYEQAYRLGHDPRALLGAAQCQRAQHHPVAAYETYERALAAGGLTPPQTQAAQRALADLGATTVELAVNVSEPDADVDLDGRAWGKTPALKHHRTSAGTHVVHVSKDGFAPFETSITVAAGDSKVVDVKLTPGKDSASSSSDLPDSEKRSAARAAFQEGVALQEKGNYAEALGRFQTAQHLYDAPTHLLHLAECLAATGKLLDAQEAYETLNRTKLDAQAPDAFVKAQHTGRTELPAVKARVPMLRLQTTPPASTIEGLVVQVNGTRMPNELLGVARPMNPGSYRIQATAGALHATSDVELKERAAVSVELHLTR